MTEVDYSKVLFGANAVHVPAWMYVQHQGDGMVSFTGASRLPSAPEHPLRYGSQRTHQFVLGEIVVRPHLVVATDALRGSGLAYLATSDHDFERMVGGDQGEIVLETWAAAFEMQRWMA